MAPTLSNLVIPCVDAKRYQFKMMQCLREVNMDHHQVGWYQSTHLESFLSLELIDTQYENQREIEESVVVIYGMLCCWLA